MDRRVVWPDFRPEHVLYEDEAIIVVHKPSGVSCQSADPERPDDLVLRLAAFLEARDGRKAYLGTHQRLDRDTSGAILYTKRQDVNAAVAKAFETRTVEKRYLAAVSGLSERVKEATLDDVLRKSKDGRVEVVPSRPRSARDMRGPRETPGGQRARTLVRVVRRKAERALVELRLETGRTHQARVQLAHAGAPIAGDPLYRGALAPRLMLHASGLSLPHPVTGKRCTVRDEDVAALDAWIASGDLGARIYDDERALARAIELAVERRWGLGRSADRDPEERKTTAFRLINEEGDALPGLAVDVYGEHLVAQLYVSELWDDPKRRDRVLDQLGALVASADPERRGGVYLKLRPKQANVLVDTRREDVAPPLPVRGAAGPEEITVWEEGVPYLVRLGDGLSTGIFLDQRENRRLVRKLGAERPRVLNLFAYTCAFSVAAALGGARRTVSVDASMAALERGRAFFAAAGIALDPASHSFVAEDAFSWLARAAKKEERFDLVVVDPPSYSSTKKRRFVAESDYDELVALAAVLVAPGGRILASCNHRGVSSSKLRRMVGEGIRAAKRDAVQIKDLPEGEDFPPALGREPNMKSVLATLR